MPASLKDALILGGMQFLNWGLCTLSWRAVAQANVGASVAVDTTLATLQYFVIRKIARDEKGSFVKFLGYTLGGVAGTVTGIYGSLWLLGK